jgi:serine protease inhibitor
VADARRVTIDRPFIFAVRDRSTGLLYELGRVVEAPR